MPTFDFKSPDGKSYTIEGPEGATPEQAFQILQTQLGGAASNAALGGADSAIRNGDPISGALVGGLIGGAMPAAEAVASPFISSIMARIDPTGAANRQVARAVAESGQSPNDIANAVRQA